MDDDFQAAGEAVVDAVALDVPDAIEVLGVVCALDRDGCSRREVRWEGRAAVLVSVRRVCVGDERWTVCVQTLGAIHGRVLALGVGPMLAVALADLEREWAHLCEAVALTRAAA